MIYSLRVSLLRKGIALGMGVSFLCQQRMQNNFMRGWANDQNGPLRCGAKHGNARYLRLTGNCWIMSNPSWVGCC